MNFLPPLSMMMQHLVQSTLFAGLAGLLALALKNHHARARHAIWLVASVKFLVPFVLLNLIGFRMAPLLPLPSSPATTNANHWTIGIESDLPIATPARRMSTVPPAPSIDLAPRIASIVWICGCGTVLLAWRRRWQQLQPILRAAEPVDLGIDADTRLSDTLIEPAVFGVWRPVLLLPREIVGRLTPDQLKAVVAHELCHIRRHDNLAAVVHMVVEGIFWFHPLVWWIGARLVEERERACDEEVVGQIGDPEEYASGILTVCRIYLESPMACVSGVTGANLTERIERIMTRKAAYPLNAFKTVLLAALPVVAIAAPIAMGVMNAPRLDSQVATATGKSPEFEVAVIKPSNDQPPFKLGIEFLPGGRVNIDNLSAEWLIEVAYHLPQMKGYVSGGPKWLGEQRFHITAKADPSVFPSGATQDVRDRIERQLLQSLLANRFKLSMAREPKEVPIYALVVAKNGLKLPASPADRDCSAPASTPLRHTVLPCHGLHGGRNTGLKGQTISMPELADELTFWTDRWVQDATGVKGNFDVEIPGWTDPLQVASAAERAGREPAPDPNNPDIFATLQQHLGLKLEPRKGMVDTYVIRHIEWPAEN